MASSSSPDSLNNALQLKIQSRRTNVACGNCRRTKTKCKPGDTSNRDCDSCVRGGLTCVYPTDRNSDSASPSLAPRSPPSSALPAPTAPSSQIVAPLNTVQRVGNVHRRHASDSAGQGLQFTVQPYVSDPFSSYGYGDFSQARAASYPTQVGYAPQQEASRHPYYTSQQIPVHGEDLSNLPAAPTRLPPGQGSSQHAPVALGTLQARYPGEASTPSRQAHTYELHHLSLDGRRLVPIYQQYGNDAQENQMEDPGLERYNIHDQGGDA